MTKEGPAQQPCPRRDRRIMFRRTRSREDRLRYRGRCQIHVPWCEESARNCRWMEGPLTQHDVATANAGEPPLPSVDSDENRMRNLLAQELESNRRRDAPLQLAHGSAIDLACAAARVTLQTSKSGEGGKEGWRLENQITAMQRCGVQFGAFMQLSPVRPRPRPPSGATEAAAQRERGASDRNREDTSPDGQTATMTTLLPTKIHTSS